MYILYKTLIGAKPLNIRFDKIDRFIRIPNGSRYLVLYGLENYASYTRIRYLKKSGILVIMQKSILIHMIFYL